MIHSTPFEIAEAKGIPIDCVTVAKDDPVDLKDAQIHSSVARLRNVGILWIFHECELPLR